jgi:glycosyltransferase involved in cell wall biosynthesis
MPEFRVGYLARGCGTRRKFSWVTYDFPEATGGWGEHSIEEAWQDFAGGRPGVILTTDDPTRRLWFSQPQYAPSHLQTFLGTGRDFQKWGYFPIDSVGPLEYRLPIEAAAAISGYDRVLAASEWGRNVARDSGRKDADWLPHGIHFNHFPLDLKAAQTMGWQDQVWLGCVMANQSRKDYPVAFDCARILKGVYGNRFRFWLHCDRIVHYWNVAALAREYGVDDCIQVTLELNDAELALRYSACDCTILPSGGEGFGFPIAESLACGTPCIVTDCAAGQELVPADMRVHPLGYRVDTVHNVRRAVLAGPAFAAAARVHIEIKRGDRDYESERLRDSVSHLDWTKLRHPWERWLREGLAS